MIPTDRNSHPTKRIAPTLALIVAATAVSTPVGTGTSTTNFCSHQPAWDAVTNTAYFTDHTDNAALATMDIATGVATVGSRFTLGGSDEDVSAIAISPAGAAFAMIGNTLYSLDLSDATLALIGSTGHIVPFAVPVFTSAAEAAGTVGSAFAFTATTSGGASTTFAITAGTLPAGLTLDPATGVISGTPIGAGTSTLTITATNVMGMTEQPFTLAIAAADAVHLPVVSG